MESNILVIVEGLKTEPDFFKQIAKSFGLKFDIYCLETNIYSLYKSLKEIDFNGDIKDVLSELHPEQKSMLSKKFAYTYLVFDCDAHHPKKEDTRNIDTIVKDNIQKLEEMSKYFTDETDPSIGRLYINYPMVESFRDCDSFFDKDYANALIKIEDLTRYKELVAKKKLNRIHLKDYTKESFSLLILQNIFKLNIIVNGKWEKLDYKDYIENEVANKILNKEWTLIDSCSQISVINTSLFIIPDFFGNKDGFYDNLLMQLYA